MAQSGERGIGMTTVHIYSPNGNIIPRTLRVPWKFKGAKWNADFSHLFCRRIWVRAYTLQSCQHGRWFHQWEFQLARWPRIKAGSIVRYGQARATVTSVFGNQFSKWAMIQFPNGEKQSVHLRDLELLWPFGP
jgi:hypothetical protein